MTTKSSSTTATTTLEGWFAGRLPAEWFTGPPAVTADREEILVVGTLAEPEYPKGADEAAIGAARRARILRFREETREQRMRIADEAESRTGQHVAGGAPWRDGGAQRTRPEGRGGRRLRRRGEDLHRVGRPGDDPAAHARAADPRHARRR